MKKLLFSVVVILFSVCQSYARKEIHSNHGGLKKYVKHKFLGDFRGFLDGADCNNIGGWCFDNSNLSLTIRVDIFVDGVKIATVDANQNRPDLGTAFGNSAAIPHGYNYSIPSNASWRNGQNRNITVRPSGSSNDLAGSPKTVNCTGGSGSTPPPPPPSAGCGSGTGLTANYFAGQELQGNPVQTITQAPINIAGGDYQTIAGTSVAGNNVSARWEGQVEAPVSGSYTLNMRTDDGTRVWFDGVQVVNDWGYFAPTDHNFTVSMNAGDKKNIKIEWKQAGGGYEASFYWTYPNQGSQLVPACRLYPTGGSTPPPPPPSPTSCAGGNFNGSFDGADCNNMFGWCFENGNFGRTVQVDIFVDGVKVATVDANQNRPDLGTAFGNSAAIPHGFNYAVPSNASWRNGQDHAITAKPCGGTNDLGNRTVNCTGGSTSPPPPPPPSPTSCAGGNFNGSFDGADCNNMFGWCFENGNFGRTVQVDIFVDGVKVATVDANQNRPDLGTAFGNSGAIPHGFNYAVPSNASWRNGQNHIITAKPCGGTNDLGNKTVNCTGGSGNANARLSGIQGLQDVGCIAPTNNPNLDPNWDWKTRTFNLWYNNRVAITQISNTLSPFWDENNPVIGKQNPNIDGDFFLEDGWMLVIRDFGTPTCAPLYPYFVLYNKYKGIMRVCVYKAVQLVGQSQSLSLSFFKPISGSRGDASMFTFAQTDVSKIVYGDIATKNLVQNIIAENVTPTSPIDAVNWGWICGDFNVAGYDPNLNSNTLFQIAIKENISLDANLKGNITLSGKATPNLSTDGGGLSGKAGLSFAKSTISAIKDLSVKKADLKAITKIAAGVGMIDAALTLVTSILGTNVAEPVDYSISLKGSVDLTGKITANIPVDLKTFYLTPGPRTDYNSVVQSIPWGLINYNGYLGFDYTRTPAFYPEWNYTYLHFLRNFTAPQILHNPQSGTTMIQSAKLAQIEQDLPIYPSYGLPYPGEDARYAIQTDRGFYHPESFFINYFTDWFIRGWVSYPSSVWVETKLAINSPTRSLGNIITIRQQLPLRYSPEIYGLSIAQSDRIGVSENKEIDLIPYPNPSANEVNIPLNNRKGGKYELNISSVDGKKIHNTAGIADVPNMNIPWSGEAGNYVVETIVNGIRKTFKISIVK